jgi:hypothetical protein
MALLLLCFIQAALIVDMLKSLQLLYNDEEFKGKVEDVCLVGHSLGGACSIIAAAKLQVSNMSVLMISVLVSLPSPCKLPLLPAVAFPVSDFLLWPAGWLAGWPSTTLPLISKSFNPENTAQRALLAC